MHLYFETKACTHASKTPVSFYTDMNFDFNRCPDESLFRQLKQQIHETQIKIHPDCTILETNYIPYQEYRNQSQNMQAIHLSLPL